MNWQIAVVLLAVFAVFYFVKRAGQIPLDDARAGLRAGALVIDVRSPAEFNSSHLPDAINLPLDGIESALPRRIPDKNQVLLLHCQSGMRSAAAAKKLKAMGYANAFNLGSYSRAASLRSGS